MAPRKTRKQKGRGQVMSRGVAVAGIYDEDFKNAIRRGDVDEVRRLISYVDVNKKDNTGNTPLHLAAADRFREGSLIISILIEKGAIIDSINIMKNTPLIIAASHNNYDSVIELIRNGADVNKKNVNGKTALHSASRQLGVDIRLIEYLLNNNATVDILNNAGETPLITACEIENTTAVNILVDRGANVNITDMDGNTPLIIILSSAIENGHKYASISIKHIIQKLLENDADPTIANKDGTIPLVLAQDLDVIDVNQNNNKTDILRMIQESLEERKLKVNDAPHIGELKLNLRGSPVPITMNDFVNGQNYVRLKKNSRQIYDIPSLKQWFNSGKYESPLTRDPIKQNNIERFTYKYNKKSTRRNNNNGRPNTKRQKQGPINNNNNIPGVLNF